MKNPHTPSPWSPLRQTVFRSIWIASIVSNIGTWMQSVGTAWLMTSLTPSPLLVALMQTAASLPIFLLGLPAGALADIVSRRKLLLVTESWLLLVALALGLLTLTGHASAWADAMREKLGDHRPPVEQNSVEDDPALIHSQLDETTYQKASRIGEEMTLDEAVQYALA